jgi:GTPase-associated protein 1, N-terminal domain type 1
MQPASIDQQIHGYRSGHQLIAASRRLPRPDQDLVDRLSDMAGQLRPNETFRSYLTMYPLPSGSDYVVARTWQDLDAPRSGCVRTRSLFVPMERWLTMDGIGALLALLAPVRFDEKPLALAPTDIDPPLKKITDPRRIELVEALFLEQRQPIVVFDSPEAEPIAERILAALWPAIKQNFAVCTFTLAPRKIEGRSFDLTFAPKSARGRFSDWNGRRIEGASKEQRHPWSSQIAERIFDTDHPDLRSIDTLGALRADQKGDEGALRLSLLWNDLAAKARTTPSAVLGMLDILNSRASAEFDRGRLQDVVQSAARLAATEPDECDALRFLSTLATKVANFDPTMLARLDLASLAQAVTQRSPEHALEYLHSEVALGRDPVVPIVVGLADGLGESRLDDKASELALRLPPDLTAIMISQSEPYAREVWNRCVGEPGEWAQATTTAIRSMNRKNRADLLRNMVPWMTADAQAPILEAALDGVSGDDLVEFAVAIGKRTDFGIAAFNEPIANAARNAESLNGLRASILSNFDDPGSDRFLLSTLDLVAADIAWLDGQMERARAIRLLRRLVDDATSRALVSVQREPTSRDRILGLLMDDVAGSADQLIRVASSSDLQIGRLLDVGRAALPFLAQEQRDKFVSELLGRALAEADVDDTRVPSLLEDTIGSMSARQLVHLATPTGASTQRVAANLVFLSKGSDRLRETAATAIEDLCERLIHRYGENLGEAGYKAWGSLLIEAGKRSVEAQLRASLPTLPFAMGKRDLPVSAVIGAAFPPVYFELLRSTGEEDFKRLPALLALPLSIFIDWDRAKSARHELVDAYLYSSWPPADLLLASISAGIQEETLHRLAGTHRGRDYLAAIGRDSHRLELAHFKRIQDYLKRVGHGF